MIEPEVLNMIAQFMSRVDLKASEIDAYQTCMAELQKEFSRLTEPETPAPKVAVPEPPQEPPTSIKQA